MRIDVHTHHYPAEFFGLIEHDRSDLSFATDPTGRRIVRYEGSRSFATRRASSRAAATR